MAEEDEAEEEEDVEWVTNPQWTLKLVIIVGEKDTGEMTVRILQRREDSNSHQSHKEIERRRGRGATVKGLTPRW